MAAKKKTGPSTGAVKAAGKGRGGVAPAGRRKVAKASARPSESSGPDLAPAASTAEFLKKWGRATAAYGYTMVPNALLEGQRRLKISAADMVVLINLLKHWRGKDSRVFPSQKTLGAASARSPRAVQRALVNLSKLVAVKSRRKPGTGNYHSNEYTFEALVSALEPIATDLAEVKRAAQAERDAALKPGIRGTHTKSEG